MSLLTRLAAPAALSTALLVAGATSASAATSTQTRGEKLLTSAIAADKSATSFTVNGSGTSSGQSIKINVTAGKNAAFGVLTYGGQSTTLRRVGTTIFAKGTKGFLEQQGATASQAAVEANKWFKISSTDKTNYDSLNQFLTVSGLLSGLVPSTAKGTVTSIKAAKVNGQAVEAITGTFAGQKGTLSVVAHGKPYLVKIVQVVTSAGGGSLTLSNFNKAVHTTAPKGAVSQ